MAAVGAACALVAAWAAGCAGTDVRGDGQRVTAAPAALPKAGPPSGVAEAAGDRCAAPPSVPPAQTALENGGAFLDLPTYDGSGQSTHFNVQFSPEGYLGHRYWMVLTPYPYRDATKENPSVLVSENGLDWSAPAGVANPVSGVPPDVDKKGHYSDGFLMRGAKGFELWFRYNPGREDGSRTDNSTSVIYRLRSADGVDWTDRETVFDGDGQDYMSPSLLAEGPGYRLWYTNDGGEFFRIESEDLRTWSEPQAAEVSFADGYVPWHQEIVATDQGYEALLLGYQLTADSGLPRFALFYAQSEDGLHFGEGRRIDPAKVDPRLAGYEFYKSSLVKDCGVYRLYLSAVTPDRVYQAFYKEVAVADLPGLFG
jgi:hypothetical protein